MFTKLLPNIVPKIASGPWTECWSSEDIEVEYGFGNGPETFTGNVITVGVNGPCDSYDYSTVEAGYAAASSGDMILIYPGTYTYNDPIEIDKDIIIRGMSDDPADIHINYYTYNQGQPNHGIFINPGYNEINVILENFVLHREGNAHYNGSSVAVWKGTTGSNVFINKCLLYSLVRPGIGEVAFGGSFGEYILNGGSWPYYLGSVYVTNITMKCPSGYVFGPSVAQMNVLSGLKYEIWYATPAFNGQIPSPNDYEIVTTPGNVANYGYTYGDHLVKFLI